MGQSCGFGGSHQRQVDNIALVQHGLIEVIDVRCGDKGLTTAFHSGYQRIASSAVQLAHHIVKKEHRLLVDDLLDDCLLYTSDAAGRFSQFIRENNRALLSLTSVD